MHSMNERARNDVSLQIQKSFPNFAIRMDSDFQHYTLANGLQVAHKYVPTTKLVHCGFILDIGSRDERPDQQGLAHFWEHMAFKGTQKRKAFHILNRLDAVGGELNAYTTKEKVCFYASVLDSYAEHAVELLTDITFFSTFPEKQIEKERGVILEEMAMYQDSPEDALQDNFDSLLFDGHALGYNILGTSETVSSFQQRDFRCFLAENLDSRRIVFSCVGNLTEKQLLRLLDKYLKPLPEVCVERSRETFQPSAPKQCIQERSISQAHCALGRTAYPLSHDRRLAFVMLTNLLGGPAMNSRLNLALREKRGYVYSIDAGYTPYTDTGLFSISFATDPAQLQKSIRLVHKEMEKLRNQPLGTLQMHYAREQLIGQLAMAEENNSSLMLMLGKSLLDLKKVDTLEEILQKIRQIRPTDLQEVAREMFEADSFSQLVLQPGL
jgi:predicted Zn-dependent peptidase